MTSRRRARSNSIADTGELVNRPVTADMKNHCAMARRKTNSSTPYSVRPMRYSTYEYSRLLLELTIFPLWKPARRMQFMKSCQCWRFSVRAWAFFSTSNWASRHSSLNWPVSRSLPRSIEYTYFIRARLKPRPTSTRRSWSGSGSMK